MSKLRFECALTVVELRHVFPDVISWAR